MIQCSFTLIEVPFVLNSVVFLDKENFITYGVTVLHFNSFTDHKCVLKQALGDAYGLLMHRNGQWEWTLAPGVSPSTRYQHAAVSDH